MPVSEERLRQLMLQGLAGEAGAQRELLTELARLFAAYFRRRLADQAGDVDDLVQEVLIAVHTRRATYDTAQPFTAWVYAIARYKLIDHARRSRVRRHVSLDDAGDLFSEDESEAATARSDLERLMDALPAGQRNAIRATKMDGLSVAEASTRLGMSESAVKVSVHRGLKALTARLRGARSGGDRED